MSDREFLVETNIQDVLKYIIEDMNVPVIKAMRIFYLSQVFEKLQDYDTGLFLESPAYIYDLFKNETAHGRIVQDEI